MLDHNQKYNLDGVYYSIKNWVKYLGAMQRFSEARSNTIPEIESWAIVLSGTCSRQLSLITHSTQHLQWNATSLQA